MRTPENPAASQFSGAKGTSSHLEQNGAKAVDIADDKEGIKFWNWASSSAGEKWRKQTGASILVEDNHYHLEFNPPAVTKAQPPIIQPPVTKTAEPYRDANEEMVELPKSSEIQTTKVINHSSNTEEVAKNTQVPKLDLTTHFSFELPKQQKIKTLETLKTNLNIPKEASIIVNKVISDVVSNTEPIEDDSPTDNKYMNWIKRGLVIMGAMSPFDTEVVPNQKVIEYKTDNWLSKTASNSLNNTRLVKTEKTPVYIPQEEEFSSLGELSIGGTNLHTFYHKFDRNSGSLYIPIKNVGHSDDNTNYKGTKGIAHFILDTDVASDYQAKEGKNFVDKQLRGENITGGSTVTNQFVPIYTKEGDKVNVKYKLISELNKEDKVMSPLRQLRFTDLDWNKATYSTDFKSTVESIPVTHPYQGTGKYKSGIINSSHFVFPKGNKNAYGKFGGGSVVFLSEKKNFAVDFAGSVMDIKNMAQQIIDKEGISPQDLIIAYHDLGSFSAKPKAKNGELKFSQWSGFNNESYTGGGLAFPN